MKLTQVQVTQSKTFDVLVVDADAKSADVVRRAVPQGAAVRVARSVDQAMCEMRSRPADLVLVNMQVEDGAGAALIERLRSRYPASPAIALSRTHGSDACLAAWRSGAADILFAPLRLEDAQQAVHGVLERSAAQAQATARHLRLRRVCKKLNKARHEISQQVDLLCNDLVRAYQDLAAQLNQTQAIAEFAAALDGQQGLEGLMRATLEWVLKKLGPINAAVYLPDSEGDYALGAYLNLDTPADEGFVAAIARSIAPHAAGGGLLHLENDSQVSDTFGNDGRALAGRTWLAQGCFVRRECLAVITVFRANTLPIDPSVAALLQAIAPVLGEKIAQAMGVHNRISHLDDESGSDEGI